MREVIFKAKYNKDKARVLLPDENLRSYMLLIIKKEVLDWLGAEAIATDSHNDLVDSSDCSYYSKLRKLYLLNTC